MKRPPFKIMGSRWAQARSQTRDPRKPERLVSGRSSHVWLHGVLVPIAADIAPGGVEIRKSPESPWHLVDYTPDEARSLIAEHYPMQRALLKKIDQRRARV